MAEFIGVEGTLKGIVLSLAEGQFWTIGRDPDEATIVLEDRKVSRKHLLCKKTEEGYTIENVSHTNPVKLNGATLTESTLLKEADVVQIGGTTFRFYLQRPSEMPVATSFEEISEEERLVDETLFKEEDFGSPEVHFDVPHASRFIFKVVSGPNTGAELALEYDRSYMIGTDTASCDIVFYDLSISRQHAKLSLSKEGSLVIEDLDSRNGVIINREKIGGTAPLAPNTLVSLGTSSFLIIDKEAPLVTFVSPSTEEEESEEVIERQEEEIPQGEGPLEINEPSYSAPVKKQLPPGSLILAVILIGMIVLLGIGMVSLFQTKEVKTAPGTKSKEIDVALKNFPAVKYTFNEPLGRLFLTGHVSSGLEKSELLYNLKGLCFIRGIDDHIVDDEAIWQETNLLLKQNPTFDGVSMHSPGPGRFVVSGYLATSKQAATLTDYLNLNFNYLDLLENCVIVIEEVVDEVKGLLFKENLNGVTVEFASGALMLTGYIPTSSSDPYNRLVIQFESIPGVSAVKNYVVAITPEQAVVDLNEKYPARYIVTGFSKRCDVNINVVINGRLLMRGDVIDGLTITSIQARTIFFEKDGLKYKLEYNK